MLVKPYLLNVVQNYTDYPVAQVITGEIP